MGTGQRVRLNWLNGGAAAARGGLGPALAAAIALYAVILLGGARAHAVPDAVLRASGAAPAAKTEQTIKLEKELERLVAREKSLKEQITAATINRAKLLAQKRADLKQARIRRDDAINKDIAAIKAKKDKQTLLIRELKNQLTIIRKSKSQLAISAAEVTIALAQAKLDDINAELKKANDRLSQSYKNYKTVYDRLTYLDIELKKILDMGAEIENKIKAQKADFSNVKSEYGECVRKKDFLAAEKKMSSLVFIQTGVNDNYVLVLDFRKRFKSDYYEQIVNYTIT